MIYKTVQSQIVMTLSNRLEAGNLLAEKLKNYKRKAIVLAIPRGGVEVGYSLAQQLNCKLDIIISKKIPYPVTVQYGKPLPSNTNAEGVEQAELDASYGKALPILKDGNYLHDGDLQHAERILKAAALTYVAGSLASLLNLWRWIAVLRR